MNNIAKKAYIWVKYLFFFGCDPIRSTIFLVCFALISTSVYFGLYTLFETLISNEILACHTYMKGAILNHSIKVDINKCSAADLHLSSKETTVIATFLFCAFSLLSFTTGNKGSNDDAIVIELRKIDDEENKKKE